MISLVTGGTGFLGSALVRRLASDGDAVRVLARPTSDLRRIDGTGAEIVLGDVTERSSVADAIAGADRVFHVAALYELGTPDPDRMWRINVGGTRNVLECAAEAALPCVHVSSVAALGCTGTEAAGEEHWCASPPGSAYEATKREAHLLARRISRTGADVRIAMPGTIYGPDDPSVVGVFHALVTRRGLPVGLLASMRMSLVFVDDCADGLVRVAAPRKRARSSGGTGGAPRKRAPGAGGTDESRHAYILAAQVVTYREWCEAIAAAAGHRPPVAYLPHWALRAAAPLARLAAPLVGVRPGVVDDGMAMAAPGMHWAFSGGRAVAELGWAPRPLAEGLAETVRWYRERSNRNRNRKEKAA